MERADSVGRDTFAARSSVARSSVMTEINLLSQTSSIRDTNMELDRFGLAADLDAESSG